MYIRMGSQYSDFEWFQGIFGRFWAQNSSKIVPENVFEPQGTFLGGIMVIFRVFLAQFGLFLIKIRVFPISAKNFLDRFRAFLDISRPKSRLKTCQKKFLSHQKHFGGYFGHFQGVFGSILGHFRVKNSSFPNFSQSFFGQIQGIFGYFWAQNSSEKFQKMHLNHQKHIQGCFDHFQGVYGSILCHF